MMKIAICDDIFEEREELRETCEKYFYEKGLPCNYEMFQSGEEVLECHHTGGFSQRVK